VKKQFPRTLDGISGLRAALWVRESTGGQFDAFGPESQREQYDRAIERYGLTSTGIEWQVAHSGRTVGATSQFAAMLEAAGTRYDVLVVGYVSRFARDLRTAVNARHELHERGAVILFADERLLSSDESAWDSWAREAVEAESYSRKLGRRMAEAYAAKRRRLGQPGGSRPPYGYIREGKPQVLVEDEQRIAIVRRAYDLSGKGWTNNEVAQDVGLRPTHVREILTNPFYAGRLRTGEPAHATPVVSPDLWDRVQTLRSQASRRKPGPINARIYPLANVIRCAFCSRRLVGHRTRRVNDHKGRYVHTDLCPQFAAERPELDGNGTEKSIGKSYKAEIFEGAIESIFEHAAVSDESKNRVMEYLRQSQSAVKEGPDRFAIANIKQHREDAARRFIADRDLPALEATLSRLDAEEAGLREVVAVPVDELESLQYLAALPQLWRETTDRGQQIIAQGLFRSIEAKGINQLNIRLTNHGHRIGLGAALGAGMDVEAKCASMVGGEGLARRIQTHVIRIVLISDDWELVEQRLVG
jgi:DNA invertase Pin-like site-specific DNA recombinase